MTSAYGTGMYSTLSKRRKVNTNSQAIDRLIYNDDIFARFTSAIVAQSYGSNQPLSDWISGLFHVIEPIPNNAQMAKKLRQERSEI